MIRRGPYSDSEDTEDRAARAARMAARDKKLRRRRTRRKVAVAVGAPASIAWLICFAAMVGYGPKAPGWATFGAIFPLFTGTVLLTAGAFIMMVREAWEWANG